MEAIEVARRIKEWDINPRCSGSRTKWKGVLENGDKMDYLLRNMHSIGLWPGNDAGVGDDVWIWSNFNVKWFDAKVTKVLEEDQEHNKTTKKKVVITSPNRKDSDKKNGDKLWLDEGWIIQGDNMYTWYKKPLIIMPEAITISILKTDRTSGETQTKKSIVKTTRRILSNRELIKAKQKAMEISMANGKKWNKKRLKIIEIKKNPSIPNKVKGFAIKMVTKAGMTKNQWHGKDVDQLCTKCGAYEDKEHAFNECNWTQEILEKIETFRKRKKITDPFSPSSLLLPILNKKTTPWPWSYDDHQQMTMAWIIWKARNKHDYAIDMEYDWNDSVLERIYTIVEKEAIYLEALRGKKNMGTI